MGGHVLWLDCKLEAVIDRLIELLSKKGKLSIDEIKDTITPITWQAALHEQHSIMKKMKEKGVDTCMIADFFGYEDCLVEELLSLDWNEEYDYSRFTKMIPIGSNGKVLNN